MDVAIENLPNTSGDPVTNGTAVAAVVCTFTDERFDLLVAAVQSLHDQRLRPAEIIVVVDHNPALLERVRAELGGRLEVPDGARPRLTVIPNVRSQGLSGGRNTALASTTCTYVAFLDDDAAADPGWLLTLRRGFTARHIVGVGGRVEPVWDGDRPGWFPPEMDWVVGCSHRGVPTRTAIVRNPFGGAMMVCRQAVQEAGGYSEQLGRTGTYPSGCEETELCIRLRRRDASVALAFEPATRIYHHVPRERMTLGYLLLRCYAEGRSKAAVRKLTAARDALTTERSYVLRTLSRGVLTGLLALCHGEVNGARRAAVIVLGLCASTAGFLAQTVRSGYDVRAAMRTARGTVHPSAARE